MSPDSSEGPGSIASLPQRIALLFDLLTTLDLRVRSALEGLEEMRRSVAPLQDLVAKFEALDTDEIGSRLDRLEASISNIERATVNLDQSFQASLDSLPDFVTKRIRS